MAARRWLLLLALVAAEFVFSEALPLTSVTKLTDRFHSIHRALRLMKRQSNGNCTTDQMEANSTHFRSCISLFANDHYIPGYTSNDTLHNFCNNNCSNELLDVITRLKRDCGGAGNLPDVTQLGEFLSQSCKHGAKNTYCIEIWNGLFDPQGSSTSIQQNYTQCIQQFNPTTFVCPAGCKAVEQWVWTNVGCCYRVPIDYNQPDSLGSSYWEICGFKEPTLCMT